MIRAIFSAMIFLSALGTARAAERAFWVWNRADPLTITETNALRTAGIRRLYWQAGELELRDRALVFRRTSPPPTTGNGGLEIVPVVRVSTAIRSPADFSGEALGQALRPIVDASPGRKVQLDFDCPSRLLPVYAERLRAARPIADIRRLTVTALAGWVDAPAADALWPVVDAVYPMLYDTLPDPAPAPGALCRPRPVLDPDELGARLRRWSRCPIPWHAGLPAFSRLTLYDPDGRSRGHLRAWDWEDLVFNPALLPDRPPANGVTVLRAARPTRVGESAAAAGAFAAWRAPDLTALRAAAVAADQAGARGVVFFRLPENGAGAGWSLPQLLALLRPGELLPSTRLTLHREEDGNRWTLHNDSDADLPPRFASPNRGYGLELELAGGGAGWREALAGDFHRAEGAAFADGAREKPLLVAIPLAQRLTFWFAALPARASLSTGLVELAPGIEPGAVRFRLPAADQPESTPWLTPD